MAEVLEISKVTLASKTYDIKDATARSRINDIESSVTGAMHYAGVTTTALTDGATTKPITIDGASYTQKQGDVVIYSEKEFVWNGTKWNEFGSTGSLKALAFKDTASSTFTPNITATGNITVASATVASSTNPLELSTTAITGATSFNAVNSATAVTGLLKAAKYDKATGGTVTVNSSATFIGTVSAVNVGVGTTLNTTGTPFTLSAVSTGGQKLVTDVANPVLATSGTVDTLTVYTLPSGTTVYTGSETLNKSTATCMKAATTNANLFEATVSGEVLTLSATAGTVTANGTATVLTDSTTLTAGTTKTVSGTTVGKSGNLATNPTYTVAATSSTYKVAAAASTYLTGITGGTVGAVDVTVTGSAVTNSAVTIDTYSATAVTASDGDKASATSVTTSTFYGKVTTPSSSHTHTYNGDFSVAGAATTITVS